MYTLRNLCYQLELDVSEAWLPRLNELDDLLGKESPCKGSKSSCWKKKKKEKRAPQEDQWYGVGPIPALSQRS
ncbi:Hypothetical predicted protein [Marmota monax]|uniref:Uncharacterized protein n=1 Tax=Marmota monax TaxID=9995 RepID=A0A5E4CG47_MARMO|nr:Hypothetical predicted protein [Marmota monax]